MYRLIKDFEGVQRLSDGAFIPFAPGNKDYEAYLKWKKKGNKPLPVEEVKFKKRKI